jgi:Conserved hypothetical ATP binding protein
VTVQLITQHHALLVPGCVLLLPTSHSDPSRFISVVLLSLMAMMRLELPHINVLSKVIVVTKCSKCY